MILAHLRELYPDILFGQKYQWTPEELTGFVLNILAIRNAANEKLLSELCVIVLRLVKSARENDMWVVADLDVSEISKRVRDEEGGPETDPVPEPCPECSQIADDYRGSREKGWLLECPNGHEWAPSPGALPPSTVCTCAPAVLNYEGDRHLLHTEDCPCE